MTNPTHNELVLSLSEKLNVAHIYQELLETHPHFPSWSGSHGPALHHYGRGGLIKHTWEVIDLGMHIIPQLNLCEKVDPIEYFLAALFHDTGKMYDYVQVKGEEDKWEPTSHRRLIHHLPQSCLVWHDCIKIDDELNKRYHDSVLHAILAHHGRREAGSPVAPKTRVAWLVHLCDGISARMNDADTLDVVSHATHGLRAGT